VTIEWSKTADADPTLMADLRGFLGADGNQLTSTQRLEPVASGIRSATNVGVSMEALKAFAQSADMRLSVQDVKASQTLNSQASFTLTGTPGPDAMGPSLGAIEGLSIQSVSWNVETGWTYAGTIL
ncbi:MAG: hypothetical protein ACYCSN_19505, partial [Acidobacteriaceae bacterium]